jgi:hypothetical protein
VKHRLTPRFWDGLGRLPAEVQRVARQNFEILKTDPAHPSLRFKKVCDFWSARAGLQHRALDVADGEDYVWVWIGSHDEYKRLIRRRGS